MMKAIPLLLAVVVGGAVVYVYTRRQAKPATLADQVGDVLGAFGGAVKQASSFFDLFTPTAGDGNPGGYTARSAASVQAARLDFEATRGAVNLVPSTTYAPSTSLLRA